MPDPSPSHTDPTVADAADDGPSGLRRWVRRVAWTGGATVAALLFLVGALLLALQTESGATAAAQWIASMTNPLPRTQLTVGEASGNWVRSLRLTNVTLARTDAAEGEAPLAHVDTLHARYHLWPLLRGRLHMEHLAVDGPAVTMRQAADSTWDWTRTIAAMGGSEPDAAPDTSAGMAIQIDSVRIDRGTFAAAFYAEGRDSTARIRDLRLRARDVQSAATMGGTLDTLGLRGRLPGDTTDLRLAARGALTPTAVSLDTLQFDSPRSRVRGNGAVQWASESGNTMEDVDLRLRATPFALRDLTLFAPTLAVDPRETVRFDLRVGGSGQRLTATADARFSGGGTVTVTADGTPTTTTTAEGPPLRYRLDAEVRDLTTSLLGPPDSTENRLNATLALNLTGRALPTLDGTADLRLTDTRWASLRTPSLTFASTLRGGTASLDLDGTLNDARLRATGQARPLDDTVSADLTTRVAGLDVANFVPDAGVRSDLAATARIRASARGTADQAVDLSLTVDSSRVGTQRIDTGRMSLAMGPERAQFDGRLRLPDGEMEATGVAALDGSERFALERARFERVPVAALMGDTTASHLTGTVRVTGRGFAPETMRLDAALDLRDSVYGPYRLSSMETEATLDRGRLTTTTDATLNGGDWTLAMVGRPVAPTPSFKITKGGFRDVDIGPFLDDTTQSSHINGTIRGRVRGTDPATLTGEAGLTLDTSRVNRQQIDAATVDLRLQDARLDTDLTIDTPEGGARLAATARPFDTVPTYRVTDGTFETLNVGAIAALPELSTALSGTVAMDARGSTAASLVGEATLSLADSRINDAPVPEGRLSVSAKRGRATTDGQFGIAGGHVQVQGTVDSLGTTPTYDLRTTVDSLNAGALAGLDSLSAQIGTLAWSLRGRGTAPSTLTATTQLSGGGVQVDRLVLDTLNLKGGLERGQLDLDTLRATSNAFESRGGGTLALTDTAAASEFSLRTEVTDAEPLRRLTGATTFKLQRGVLTMNVYGSSLASQRFDGTVEVKGLAYEDVRVTETDLSFNGVRGRERWLQQFALSGTVGYLSLPGFSTEETRLRVTYDGVEIGLSSQVRLDSERTADLGATITPGAEQTDVSLTRLNLRLEGDRWSLLQPASITVSDHYRIRGFLLQSADQQIAADGIVDVAGTQSLVVTAEEVDVGAVAPLLGFEGVDGTLNGSIDLTGPATAPRLDSRLALDLRTENRDVGTLRLTARYRDYAMDVNANLTHTDGSTLRAAGTIPTDLRLRTPDSVNVAGRPVRLDVTTERFPVDWIDPFLDPETVRNVRGILGADVEVRGTLDAPKLSGKASLANGGATLPALQTRYHGATGTLQFADNQIVLEKATVRSRNGGRLRAEGTINFPQLTVGEYDITVNASDFLAIDTRAYRRATIGGAMALRGTIQRPVLDGTVRLQSADIFYNEALAESAATATAVQLSEADRLTLENRFGLRLGAADTTTYDAYEALKVELTVKIQRNTWLRSKSNPELDVQFTGDLDLTKAHDEDAQVFGSIQVVTERSTLRQFGQEFQITEGTLTFNGDPSTPYLNLAAVYEQRAQGAQGTEVRITLQLEGRPEELTPTLSSEPPMETRNILSYLATGRPADKFLSGGEGGSGSLATKVALGQATNFVENLAASELGLDVVRVQIRTSGVSYLTVGRYFTSRLFVALQQPVTTSGPSTNQTTQYLPDLTVEYQLLDTLMLRALNNQQSLQLNLLFEYAY